jgi:DNA (cytosine-5)-methyltransferase 1
VKYLSVCSGIEAASVAWHHLGWTPVAFSEIEPFPSAVLAHRFPDVPNLGDMTNHAAWLIQPGDIDLLVGGTPCQSFSVAGLRRGLSDPRGGLMLTYLEIARRLRPRWIVWENVPGVLSSGRGRDFGAFLGALGELGYGWAYRILDAQWVRTQRHPRAVPQRRRRVFVVGCLGDWTAPAEVLFERESVCRDPAPSRASRKSAAADAEDCARSGRFADDVAPCLETTAHDYSRADGFTMIAQQIGFRWQNNRVGLQEDDAVAALRASAGASGFSEMNHPVIAQPTPFRKSKRAQSATDDDSWVEAEQANTLNQFDTGERDTHAVAHGFYSTVGTHGLNHTPEVSPAVKVGSGLGIPSPPAVAFTTGNLARGAGASPNTDVFQTLQSQGATDQHPCVAFTCKDHGADAGTVAPTMRAMPHNGSHPNGGGQVAVAMRESGQGYWMHDDIAGTLRANGENRPSRPSHAIQQQSMIVRRLTPRECERLQGFPDDWTLVPWRKREAIDCPDGPRYKALGNSMAVNCMEWIGERIAAREAR